MAMPFAEASANDHVSTTGAAIVAGIAGVAVGAAIADSANQHPDYAPPRYQAYPAAQPYPYPEPYPYPQPYPPPYPYAQPYPQPYPNYYPRPAYRHRYAAPFRPTSDVVCYPNKGLCFNDNGSVANKWTRRIFGN